MCSTNYFFRFVRLVLLLTGSAMIIFNVAGRGPRPASAAVPFAGEIYAVAVSGSDLYIGGTFTSIGNISANNIARYNLTTKTWSALGGGLNNGVSAIAINGGDVYVGGRFTLATNPGGDGVPVTCVVKWNALSNTWAPLGASGTGANGVNGDVAAIAVSGTGVFVGGNFKLARNNSSGTVSVNGVARWDGSAWSALGKDGGATGNGVTSPGTAQVFAIAVSGNDVYVGGAFTRANSSNAAGVNVNCIAKWNVSTQLWSPLGAGQGNAANGTNGDVLALAVNGAEIYVGGNFNTTFNNLNVPVSTRFVAKWNGTTWSGLGTGTGAGGNGTNGSVFTLFVSGGLVYAGGDFSTVYNGTGGLGVSSVSTNCIARWNGTSWAALGQNSGSTGNGVDGPMKAITASGVNLFVGGEFLNAFNGNSNQIAVNRIAQWNGSVWSALGAGTPGGGAVTTVSAASFSASELSAESIATAYGTGLATATQSASTSPLPTSLAGSTVKVKDAAGTERLGQLFFVSPGQINFLIPAGTAAGTAAVTIAAGDGKVSTGSVQIAAVSPAIFTANANGQGVPAATLFRLKGNGAQSYEAVLQFNSGTNQFVPKPIDLGPTTDQAFLVLNGSGVRFRSALSAVTATVGGVAAEVVYAGPQGSLIGLDQINVRIPRDLVGRGEVDVVLLVNGKFANTVKVSIM
jgi:uncharacterized protein (TIGR03437 family)